MTTSITDMAGCSVEFPGRVIAALAIDADLSKKTGGEFITAELAAEYGITDIDGSIVPSARPTRGSPIWQPVVKGTKA
jgi:4'-phosphopantetheinyl transferase EntD